MRYGLNTVAMWERKVRIAMSSSKIEWTERTWNPITGCSKMSMGCKYCYAERQAVWLSGMGKSGYDPKDPFGVKFHADRLDIPTTWRKPSMVFVCSMGDLFHGEVEMGWLDQVFRIMAQTPQHTYQVLTKRPGAMREYLRMTGRVDRMVKQLGLKFPLPNVWLGTTVEHQRFIDRVNILLDTPAAVRFVSVEPMLGPVDLGLTGAEGLPVYKEADEVKEISMPCGNTTIRKGVGWIKCDKGKQQWLNWVICGGESGHNARPMHPDWPRGLRDQCAKAGVPFFFKQWGEWAPCIYGSGWDHREGEILKHHYFKPPDNPCKVWKVGKKQAGCLLDGKEYMEYPDVYARNRSCEANNQLFD